jgi:hypothetical protein
VDAIHTLKPTEEIMKQNANNVIPFRPRQPVIWHGLYFISLSDRQGMSEAEAAERLKQFATLVTQHFPDLELDLDEDSINLYDPNEE